MLDTIDNSSSPSAVGVTAGASGTHHFKRTLDQLDNSSSPASVVVTAGESWPGASDHVLFGDTLAALSVGKSKHRRHVR